MSSWVGNGLFAITAVPAALGVDAFGGVAVGMALFLFFASWPVWGWAFVLAASRSAQGDNVVVANLFVSVGDAPRDVRFHLFGSLALGVTIALATMFADPFGVLVPMLPLGFVGLWAARHGTFPPRPAPGARRA